MEFEHQFTMGADGDEIAERLDRLGRFAQVRRALRQCNEQLTEQRRVMSALFDYSRSLSSALALGAVLAKTVSVAAASDSSIDCWPPAVNSCVLLMLRLSRCEDHVWVNLCVKDIGSP